jgi:DNA primase
MIPDRIVEEVRARADLVEVVGEQIQLKRAGKDFKALCPFHHEKTPSFYVAPSKGFYKCFGCGETGDAFTFLMKRSGMSFVEAVRHLAGRVGVEIPESEAREAEDPSRSVYEAVAFAVDHFQRLLSADEGAEARQYLERRGVSDEAVARFQLGYAPEAWQTLREAAHRHGIEDDILLRAGLIKESERGAEPYDRFRHRLIFPISDVGGRLIAFGGRTLARAAANVPKYLNSPETEIFHKGRALYGLNWSKRAIRREGAALVVEGFMDYVSLAARGVEHVVAGLGTALTAEQANLLARYTGKAILLYDSDRAGLNATFRGADALLHASVHPLVVSLPEGEDPDSLVRNGGAQALHPLVESALDVLELKIQMLDRKKFFEDSDGRRRALDKLLPTLRSTIDPVLRDIYVARIAERTGVRRETLEHELATSPEPHQLDAPFGGHGGPGRSARRRYSGRERTGWTDARALKLSEREAERLLLILLVRDPAWVPIAAESVTAADLHDPAYRALYEHLVSHAEAEDPGHGLEPAVSATYETLRAEPMEISDVEHTFRDVVADLRERSLRVRLDGVAQRLSRAGEAEQGTLIRDKERMHRELSQLGVRKSIRLRRYAPREKTPSPQPEREP